jgi:hypothetical protein
MQIVCTKLSWSQVILCIMVSFDIIVALFVLSKTPSFVQFSHPDALFISISF